MITQAEVRPVTITLHCQYAMCPSVVKRGRAEELGKIVGTEAHIVCPRCRRVTHWRAPRFDK